MNPIVAAALAIIKSLASNPVVKKAAIELLREFAKRTSTTLDDVLVEVFAEAIGVPKGEVSLRRAI